MRSLQHQAGCTKVVVVVNQQLLNSKLHHACFTSSQAAAPPAPAPEIQGLKGSALAPLQLQCITAATFRPMNLINSLKLKWGKMASNIKSRKCEQCRTDFKAYISELHINSCTNISLYLCIFVNFYLFIVYSSLTYEEEQH